MKHNPLEYEEEGEDEGLFTDEEDVRQATEASLQSHAAETIHAEAERPKIERPKVTLAKVDKIGLGPKTLRECCSKVIMRYHLSITDVGEDIMYEQIQFMLEICERPQLEEIERNSPQLRPDTDHLWEAFMRKEYGKRYTELVERKGKVKWRKQFKLEKERQEERARTASGRLKENYARLQEEKKAKKMVVIAANMEPPQKKRRTGWSSSTPAPTSKLDRIRRDTSAARKALTHASGLARPSPSRPSTIRPSPSARPPSRTPITESPRAPVSYKYETPGMSVTSAQSFDPFRGTTPRVAPAPKPAPSTLRPIVKPAVKNFQPPSARGDFFASTPRPPPKIKR